MSQSSKARTQDPMMRTTLILLTTSFIESSIVLCPPQVGDKRGWFFLTTDENPVDKSGLLVISGDGGGTWWDKTCGYPWHFSCSPPYTLAGAVREGDWGMTLYPVVETNLVSGIGLVVPGSSHDGDELATLVKINIVDRNELNLNPYFTYGDTYFHDEPWSTKEVTDPYYIQSSGTLKGAPLDPLCFFNVRLTNGLNIQDFYFPGLNPPPGTVPYTITIGNSLAPPNILPLPNPLPLVDPPLVNPLPIDIAPIDVTVPVQPLPQADLPFLPSIPSLTASVIPPPLTASVSPTLQTLLIEPLGSSSPSSNEDRRVFSGAESYYSPSIAVILCLAHALLLL